MAQQKRRKKPISIDGKNIFTYCFQPIQLLLTDDKNIFTYYFQSIQRLQPNSKTCAIRNFKYTKYNGDNPKSRIFSFIPQRRHI